MYFNFKVHSYLSHYYSICLLMTSCLAINDHMVLLIDMHLAICHLIFKFTANDDVIHKYVTICHILSKYTASNDLIHT